MFGRKRKQPKIDLEPIDLGKAPDEALPARWPGERPPASRREAPPARSARGRDASSGDGGGMPRSYRWMVLFSFGLNLVLLLVLAGVGLQLFVLKNGFGPAQPIVRDLQGAVEGMQNATIYASVPLNEQLPISLQVPVQQDTLAVTTAPVPLNNLPAHIVFPGVGELRGAVSLQLPAGMQLPVHLDMTIPLTASVPVNLTVPVSIPLRDTELGPPFEQLGRAVEPLQELVDPK